MRVLCLLIVTLLLAPMAFAQEPAAGKAPVVRVLTTSFVLPAKFRAIDPIARQAGVTLESIDVETATSAPGEWFSGADLVILDVPRPSDRARVEKALGDGPGAAATISIGGGPPRWSGIEPGPASLLLGSPPGEGAVPT